MDLPDVRKLFPTRRSFFVFLAYMVLFINQGILVTATKNKDNKYSYNTTTVVLLIECLKLVIATTFLFLKNYSFKDLLTETLSNYKMFFQYFVPAGLYCLYNNLQFVNLAAYDPTTYYLLLQFRVVVTGVIFQILFKKVLSRLQWLSLLLLTLGCIVKHLNYEVGMRTLVTFGGDSLSFHVSHNLLLMLVQIFCSCFAGVYNEYLIKGRSGQVSFWVQNLFMYLTSILCNLGVLALTGDVSQVFTGASLRSVLRPTVLGVILNGAVIGIVVSLFLQSLNSILKTFASALELMVTALLCWVIFGIPVDRATFVAIAIVTVAVVLYASSPVTNVERKRSKSENQSENKLEKKLKNNSPPIPLGQKK